MIGYWQGKRNVRQVHMFDIYQEGIGRLPEPGSDRIDRFDFIYRRFNKAADKAAGIGAEMNTGYEEQRKPDTDAVVQLGVEYRREALQVDAPRAD